jgi:structural maintenance of chromosome 4
MEEDGDSPDHMKLEEEATKAQALLQECRLHRKDLQEDLKNLKKNIKSLELKLPRLSLEISGFETTRSGLQSLIPQLRSKCALNDSDASLVADLRIELQKYEKEMASCSDLAIKLEADVASLQKAIFDAGGPSLKKQQVKCEKITTEIQGCEKSLVAAQVAVTTNDKAAAKAKKDLRSSRTDLAQCSSSIDTAESALLALQRDALAVKKSFEEVQEIEKESRMALDDTTKECDELKKSVADLKCKEIELLGQVDYLENLLGEGEKRLSKWSTSLEKLRSEDKNERIEDPKQNTDDASFEPMIAVNNLEVDGTVAESGFSLPVYTVAILERYNDKDLQNDINILENERNSMAKNANMAAIAEYRKKEVDYLARVDDLECITEQRNDARKQHEDLRRQRLEMFMDGFGQITLRLKEMYQMITLGGDAELELVDSLDPFSEGIVFSVRPPKKSWKNISNLSGGEKTLSSLALVFALHHFKPTPLYVMDEIDAALDFKNVSIVANYIKERTRNAQFIIISLRNNMFELADRLVGIYKTHNCTKSVTIDPKAFAVKGCESDGVPQTLVLANRSNMAQPLTNVQNPSSTKRDVGTKVSFESDP